MTDLHFTPWRRQISMYLPSIAVAVLTVYFFQPAASVMDVTLDYSNFASYAFFTAHHAQFGTDVISMVGPYGFAHYGFLYAGYLFWTRLILDLVIKGVLSVLVIWFVRQPGPVFWRALWFTVVLAIGRMTEDIPLEVLIFLSGLYLLVRFEHPRRQTVQCLLAVVLAFLTLCKGTQTVLVLATFGLVGVQAVITRHRSRMAWIAVSYVAAYLSFWIIAGQNPLHIPAFLRGTSELASGYNAALSVQEPASMAALGFTAIGALIAAGVLALWLNRQSIRWCLATCFFLGFAFVEWKHGFVRADGHVFLFFHFGVFGALTLMLWPPQTPDVGRGIRWAQRGCAIVALLAAGYGAADHGAVIYALKPLASALPGNVQHLLHANSEKARLEEKLDSRRSQFDLPLIRQAVEKQAGVDFFGFEHGYIPLNRLRYQPRPMSGGSFNVYTPYLMQRNAEFINDPTKRPKYFLLKLQTVDERLVAQDDALALRAIVENYEPRLVENGLLLLRAGTGAPKNSTPHAIASIEFSLGERVSVPAVGPNEILLMSMEFEPTLFNRLRSLLYKPGHLYMDVEGADINLRKHRRIVPAMIGQPVILNPYLEDTSDFIGIYARNGSKTAVAFTITSEQSACYGERARAKFFTIPRPSAPRDVDIAEILTYARSPLWNVKPDSIEPADAPQRTYGGLLVQFLHAPGKLEFKLNGTERELVFSYGFDPTAEAQTEGNGVTFLVELERPSKERQELFRRHLTPMKVKADKGNHTASVSLPTIEPGSKLLIRTDPGPFGDNAWDWSYVTRIQIKRGPYHLKLFPGFSIAPVRVEGDNFGAVKIEGRDLFMMNSTGLLEFDLGGTEETLTFAGGILPGAYTNGGESDGVAFIVEYRHPDGHLERLFYRHIRPRIEPTERGDQVFKVKLPFHPPGTRLRVIVDPGPAGDKSWDWSYISKLELN